NNIQFKYTFGRSAAGVWLLKKLVAPGVSTALFSNSVVPTFPPLAPLTPFINAAIKSGNGFSGAAGVTPFVLYQLLTFKLNLSPAITFKVMDGPTFWLPAAVNLD